MVKLYRTSGGVTEYWEAWITATDVTIHWGKLGDKGEMRELPHEDGLHPSEIVKREAKPIRAAGFKPRKTKELNSVVIQYKIQGRGTVNDHDRRVQVEERMNECLGWTGLGHCDGGDMGSGQMNVFCYVVDAAIAEKVIVSDLDEHGLLDGAVIAERVGDEAKVLWPHDFAGTFAIL
ncbi:MAG TPA: hypothetical protein VMI10_05030 [Terriglobales bacterium]|nr:hypothetical protein [Terriglobales bacterium]